MACILSYVPCIVYWIIVLKSYCPCVLPPIIYRTHTHTRTPFYMHTWEIHTIVSVYIIYSVIFYLYIILWPHRFPYIPRLNQYIHIFTVYIHTYIYICFPSLFMIKLNFIELSNYPIDYLYSTIKLINYQLHYTTILYIVHSSLTW